MATEERTAEVKELLGRVREWVAKRDDIAAVGLVGSWAHGDARMDSEVDFVLLTTEQVGYLQDEAWVAEPDGLRTVNTERWGPTTERRFVLPGGLEVEVGIAPPSWAATNPVNGGTRRECWAASPMRAVPAGTEVPVSHAERDGTGAH